MKIRFLPSFYAVISAAAVYAFALSGIGNAADPKQAYNYTITKQQETKAPSKKITSKASLYETSEENSSLWTSSITSDDLLQTNLLKSSFAANNQEEKEETETAAQTTATTAPQTTTLATTTTTPATTTTTQTTTETSPPQTQAQSEPAPKNLDGDTVIYTYNGSRYEENSFDAVCKIVAAEMNESFEIEALKAQAVAVYSYLKYSNENGSYPSVSMKSSIPSKIKNAVSSVYGLAAYYNGDYAQTVYCSSTGGATNSAKNVWGRDIPYLQSVPSEYDMYDRYYGVQKVFSQDEVRSIIESTTGIELSSTPENWFTILPPEQGGILDSGYIGKMLIDGNSYYIKNGNKVAITGRVLRENIFAFRLNSAKFDVSYRDGQFVFTTYGCGHGVGMSQLGANLYAQKGGYNYLQILQHYYPGVTIQ
ncbi:MAG: SpoIID/LytB domain-containing protein [Oscillospiraceae bacterium]|nr:SpoIID/LytB domain-containing protein [Oscillospiraceae bacterium]